MSHQCPGLWLENIEMFEVQQEVWLPMAPDALQWPDCVLDQLSHVWKGSSTHVLLKSPE